MASILIIEDDSEVMEYLIYLLSHAGHTVGGAKNAPEGVAAFRENPAQILITDIIMPDMDGLEVITELRRYHPGLKIIAISGGGSLAPGPYLRSAKILGADRTLSKPFSNDEILTAVNELAGEAGGYSE